MHVPAGVAGRISALPLASMAPAPSRITLRALRSSSTGLRVGQVPLALRQPGLAHLPVRGAEALADLATRRKALALVYVLGLYFALPAALVFSVGSR